jgi:hypothetical protein
MRTYATDLTEAQSALMDSMILRKGNLGVVPEA